MKNVSLILLGATLLSAVACGNKDSGSSRPSVKKDMLLTSEGAYQATLSPINAHLAGDVSGTATVRVKGDSLTVEVKVNGAPAETMHAQYIHVAKECPTLSSDMNKDGVIDAVEGKKSFGPVIIPLDGELRTQVEKSARFPITDFSGNYYYKQMTSVAAMMKDLTMKDNNAKDDVVKLKSNLSLEGRQVVIYGVKADADLPATVQAMKGHTKHASLPIACGSLVKIADTEGTTTNGGKEE